MTVHAGLYGPETLLDGAGRPRRLTNVVVYQGDGVTPAVLYADRTKATTLSSNAVQTDSDGNLAFYADPGMHVIRWTSAGVTRTLTVEVPVDYADVGSGPGGGGAVSSVFGRIGDVLLTKADVVGTGLAPDDIGADAAGAAATRQPLDADLTAIAALDTSTAGTLATDGAGWIKKTYAQLKAALGITTSDVSGFTAAAAAAAPVQSVAGRTGAVTLSSADLSDKGAAGGVASLDGSGKVPQAQVPSVALTDFLGAVASQAAMLALTGQRGDWCTRTDLGTDWQLIADDPTQLANWRQHVYPASPVSSVAGRTGAVVLSTADVSGLGTAATHPATDFDAAGAAAAVLGQPLALAGATQPTRYVGRWAATGAPTSGTFAVGDFGFDGTNTLRICTAAGTPGTWASSGASLPASPANTWVVFGDSLAAAATVSGTDGTFGAYVGYGVRGYLGWASQWLGHRLKLLNNAGVSGDTTTQMLARITSDVINYAPGWVVVEGGRNDISASTDAATIEANLLSIYTQLLAAGCRVVATTITPRDADGSTLQATLHTVNRWIKDYARTTRGVILADFHGAVADPATGHWQSGLSYDGTHPKSAGAARIGRVLAAALAPFVPDVDMLTCSNADTTSLHSNAMTTGTAGTLTTGVSGSVATGYTVDKIGATAISVIASKVARTDGLPGEWQQIQHAAGLSRLRITNADITTTLPQGSQYVAQAEFETDVGFAPTDTFMLITYVMTSGFSILATSYDLANTTDVWDSACRVVRGRFRTPPLTVPANATQLQTEVRVNGSATYRVSRIDAVRVA